MLKYFIDNSSIEPVGKVIQYHNETKKRIASKNYSDIFKEYNECNELFKSIIDIAKNKGDEQLANSAQVFKYYFLLFCDLGTYFKMLENKEYHNSWNKLQDCIDDARCVGKFTEMVNRQEVPSILNLLRSYESLYPYCVFSSSEYIITHSHCSICGKSMQSLECPHIKGNLYWGEFAVEVIDEIKEFQAVCLVSHPENKRCVIELSDDTRTEREKFQKLDQFLELGQNFLRDFIITTRIENRIRQDIRIVGRNESCSCGSGVKFKKCCGKDLYYKHERNIVTPKNIVKLITF